MDKIERRFSEKIMFFFCEQINCFKNRGRLIFSRKWPARQAWMVRDAFNWSAAMLEEWNILLGIELYFYANSSFVSLCKYGFWSHERTHSIVRTHFRCAPSANTKAAVIIFPISGDYGNEGLDFVSFQFRPRSMNSSCTTVPYVQVFHRSRWNPSTPYNTHFYFQDSISNLDVN